MFYTVLAVKLKKAGNDLSEWIKIHFSRQTWEFYRDGLIKLGETV